MKKNNYPVPLFAALFFTTAALAGALEITGMTPSSAEKNKTADLVFSGSITVKGVSFDKGAVLMPVTENKGRTYKDVKLISKSLYKKIEACFLKGKCSSSARSAPPVLSIQEVKLLRSAVRVANVSVAFDGDLSVTVGVMKKASGEFWTAYPDSFEINDDAFRDLVKKKIMEGFGAASKEDKKAAAPAEWKKRGE